MARRKNRKNKSYVAPSVMANASKKATGNLMSTQGYYGNIGDSIERRFNPIGGGTNLLGGGQGYIGEGVGGAQGYWPAASDDLHYGFGIGFGPHNRAGPWSNIGYNNSTFKYLRAFASNSSFNHEIIAKCILAFYTEGIINRVVNIFADFATEGLEIIHPNSSTQNIINAWMHKAKIKERVRTFFMTMFATGTVFIHRRWARLNDDDLNKLRRYNHRVYAGNDMYVDTGESHEKINIQEEALGRFFVQGTTNGDDFLKDSSPETSKNVIPWGYSAINPLQMDLRGGKFRGTNYWIMMLSRNDVREFGKFLTNQSGNIANSGGTLPPELQKKYDSMVASQDSKNSAELEFSDDDLYVLQDSKFDWNDWAVPFVYPALKHISFKHCLRNMELQACHSVINTVFLYRLGDIKKGMPAEEEHFERLSDMLQMPARTLNIIWNEAIEAEVLQADVAKLFDPKKHESADRDILISLGMPEVLLGGKGGTFASSFVSVASVLERLETARESVTEWLMTEIKLLADALSFRKLPSIRWGKSSLRDENQWLTLVMSLADRGVLSRDTLLKEFNISEFDVELSKQKREESQLKDTDPNVMSRQGPYVNESLLDNRQTEQQISNEEKKKESDLQFQMDHIDEIESVQTAVSPQDGGKNVQNGPNGRPPNSKKKNPGSPPKKQGKTRTPKGQAAMLEYEQLKMRGLKILADIEVEVNKRFCDSRGLKYVKAASKSDREDLENCIYYLLGSINPDDEINDIGDYLDQNHILYDSSNVDSMYQNSIQAHIDKYNTEPTRAERRQYMVSAWACNLVY